MPDAYSKKLETAFANSGQLCVGIDPHEELLIDNGFAADHSGLLAFSLEMLEQLAGVVSIVKPQVSFFERYGSVGMAVLEQVLTEATNKGFLVIADAKRGDIGSTMEAYAQAWLGQAAPFSCNALTVNPYLGVGALAPAIATSADRGKALYVLSATSNPEAARLQSSVNGSSVAKQVADEIATLNRTIATSNTRFGNLGLVIGATVDLKALGLFDINENQASHRTSILAPGFGYQGAELGKAKAIFGPLSQDVIFTVSRSALREGIKSVRSTATGDQNTLHQALKA